jgi:hypothetical protein
MPSVSKKQHNFMAAVANNPKFAKKAGVPSAVGKDFLEADKGKKFRSGGLTSKKAGINKQRTNHGKIQMPNYSLLKYAGKKEGGVTTENQKDKDMKKMNPGMMAMMAKKKPMKMADGGMAHSDMAKDKPMMKKVAAKAVKGHEKKMHGMARGGGVEIKGKTKGTMIKMKSGGSC